MEEWVVVVVVVVRKDSQTNEHLAKVQEDSFRKEQSRLLDNR